MGTGWEAWSRLFTAENEDRRAWVYDDVTGKRLAVGQKPKGNPTVGIGFNLRRPDAPMKLRAVDANFRAIVEGREPLKDAQIDTLYATCWHEAVDGAQAVCSTFGEQPDQVRVVLTDMSFQMGRVRLRGFRRMLGALAGAVDDAALYQRAADEVLLSDYAKETPKRALKNRNLLLELLPAAAGDIGA